jgi:hypothetical protein
VFLRTCLDDVEKVKNFASTGTLTPAPTPNCRPARNSHYTDCAITALNLSLLKIWKKILLVMLVESLLIYWPQHSQVWGAVTTCPRRSWANISVFYFLSYNSVIFTSARVCSHQFLFSSLNDCMIYSYWFRISFDSINVC